MAKLAHVSELLPEYALGTLGVADVSTVEAHLASCAACRKAAASLAAVPGLSVAPVSPPPTVLQKLDAHLATGARFDHYAERIAEFFDVSPAEARFFFGKLLEPASWEPGPAEGIQVMPVQVGPRHQGALSAFVRIPPGRVFPMHEHVGEETNLVIQGGFREGRKEVWAGELVKEPSGSKHEQTGLPGVDCIAATLLDGMIELVEAPTPKKKSAKRRR